MKKTFITLLALAGVAVGADTLTVETATSSGYNADRDKYLTSVSEWGYFWNLQDKDGSTRPDGKVGNAYANGGVLTSITTEGNADYDLQFMEKSLRTVYVNEALYFNAVTLSDANLALAFTIDFGTAGSITTAQNINFGQKVTAFNFSATLTEEQIQTLANGGTVNRTLLAGNGNSGIWNFGDRAKDNKELTLVGLDSSYEYVGQISDASTLSEGQYGILWSDGDADSVSFVVKGITPSETPNIPEPATATLSLLALAGLCARRRRA